MKEINIEKTDFTLWEIEFEISKKYDSNKFSFEEAKKDFYEKIGVEATNISEEEEFERFEYLTTEIQYFACDSGHGGNIINDCLNALKEDSPGFGETEWEYSWNKRDYKDYLHEPYIQWALDISSYGQIKIKDGVLSGDCLLLVWDECNCDQCENEL
jgi:hypothetical protein